MKFPFRSIDAQDAGLLLVCLAVPALFVFLCLEILLGRTVDSSGVCLAHRFIESRTEYRTEMVGSKDSQHLVTHARHVPERFILTVEERSGRVYDLEVSHALYASHPDGAPVLIRHRHGRWTGWVFLSFVY